MAGRKPGGFPGLLVLVTETEELVGEQIRARFKWAIMQWLGVLHAAILAAADCNGQGRALKYDFKPKPACWS